MSKFSWGHSFYELNEYDYNYLFLIDRNLFEMYRTCTDSTSVLLVQNKFLEDEKNAPKYEPDAISIESEASYESTEETEELFDRFGNLIVNDTNDPEQ